MARRREGEQVASPYSTGGGGTVLEHRFGATLLANLLMGDPVPALGDEVVPASVRFQASAFSPVDDLVVVGDTPDGGQRRLSIGVRRAPSFTSSDAPTVGLLVSYLRVVTDHWDEVRVGRWRLGLAVVSPNPAVRQLGELGVIAHGQPDEEAFRAAVNQVGRSNSAARTRLKHLDALVAQAAADERVRTEAPSGVLTWRLLHVLRLRELRLEGTDESDRTVAVARLRGVVPDSSLARANALFDGLERLSRRYAPAAATVTGEMVRRDLSGTVVERSPSFAGAWRTLDALSETAAAEVRFGLIGAGATMELPRAGAGEALVAAMGAAASRSSALVITGEPDAGKSALALRTARRVRTQGAAVTVLNLRQMPATLVELEALLGARLAQVLGASAVGTGRLLLVDGAESVLEGRGPLLSALARAAMSVGLGVVAVTRTDGFGAVRDLLEHAAREAQRDGGGQADEKLVVEHEVARLTLAEISQVVEAFPQLRRWAGDQRAVWLLGRPGLVDMLLRAGPEIAAPDGPVSEADLFAAVWHHLVRRGGVTGSGAPSPEARDQALQRLARRELLPDADHKAPDAAALPSLRSDGLLAPLGATGAWQPADRFAGDLVRDMAIVRVLVTEGFEVLSRAQAPRWALRAARVACQARLLGGDDIASSLRRLRAEFDRIAVDHGQRWSDVPWEAVLTLGEARQVLSQTWSQLQAERYAALRTVIRLAMQRHTTSGVGDPVVLGPLVEATFCRDRVGETAADDDGRIAHEIGRSVRELVLAWLRGLVVADGGPVALRQRVRDRILAAEPDHWDEFAVEALATLGPDLDDRVAAFLQDIAADGGARLDAVVERSWPSVAMARHQPDLLLVLAESYYIERYDAEQDEDDWAGSSLCAGGIRHHRGSASVLDRLASWSNGPFWYLLTARMVPTLAMINRMLDHAARIRVTDHDAVPLSMDELPGVELDLPGIGVRECVGDESVWAWYRGSSDGPYPCVSALLAAERLADQLVAIAGVPVEHVARLLLHECNNLAMPGLVVGFLVRHLEHDDRALDPWLRSLEVWHLEFARMAGEGVLHVQGPDPADLVGRARRGDNLRDIAAELTIRATLAGDHTRLEELAAVGEELIRRADALLADSDGGEEAERFITSVRGWAATFDPQNYHRETDESGNTFLQYAHPEDLAARMRPEAEAFARASEAMRLQNTYVRRSSNLGTRANTPPLNTLLADVALARSFGDDLPDAGLDRLDPSAAVAAAAALAHVRGHVSVSAEDLRWATNMLIRAATAPPCDDYVASSVYPAGADRSAATGLPALLAAASPDTDLDRPGILEALEQCATSRFHETRVAFAQALHHVWSAPCDTDQWPGVCHHVAALDAVRAGLRDCRLGDGDPVTGIRGPLRLDGPYEQTLPAVETRRLYLTTLIPPLIAVASASRSHCCVADQAGVLLDVVLDAHARATDHWAHKRFQNRHSRHGARVIVELAVGGNTGPLTGYVRRFASNASALHGFMDDLAVLFTYDDDLRPCLPDVWPLAMDTALQAIGDATVLRANRYRGEEVLAGLLPAPRIDASDVDIDATLTRARAGWLHPDSIADLVDRWIPLACHESDALDALAKLARCAPLDWQRGTGLLWAEQLADDTHHTLANQCWYLTDWLADIHSREDMTPEQARRWRRMVDGLAAAGDRRAAKLQRIEE